MRRENTLFRGNNSQKGDEIDLPIMVFEVLADIAKENKVRSVRWAEASGIEPSRFYG